ncbi:serine carboxypeptidase-like 11 isoform X2 [Camellia sinensis]|uniref:serine carboxypeptidase-like 11 isoform X2 n=1 Tax=Camellia sinensis TaxID=4442 RepID=UPI0010361C16|nr:serine carboxypeptidase-like 11 isoform X2 [Camellia sinensis]
MLVFAFVDFTGFHWNCTLRLDCEDFTRLFRRFTLHSRNRGHSGVDPLILYLNGGPGCSGLNGLFYQSGPLEFNLSYPGHGIPELIHCLHSWTKTANIIFIDVPVGARFHLCNKCRCLC